MQSYLGEYPGCASNREEKIIRAIESIINQTFKDWELIVVADGCDKTVNIVCKNYEKYMHDDNEKIKCFWMEKQPEWSGKLRDAGKYKSKGEYVIYLDSDDYYIPEHLQIINDQLANYDWVYYNDFIWQNNKWHERICVINQSGKNGTSNVCLKRHLDVIWSVMTGYSHDHWFNQQLVKKYKNCAKIETPGYMVCHLPPHPGGKGYDI